METRVVSAENDHTGDRTVAVEPSEEEFAALDVFGTEALDSVCGVGILDPSYRPDVRRVISLWSILFMVGTTVLTLGFFGCFRRLKGENLDLSHNLWTEDLFWTSLIIFMLTCLAVTCGLSALASHTNLYSHAKVLGFRRVFRWCLTLHAAAAVFALVVAVKLTLVDLLEAESSVTPSRGKKTSGIIMGDSRYKGLNNVNVYPRVPHVANRATSSTLPPMAFSLYQLPSAGAHLPTSAEKSAKKPVTVASILPTEAPAVSLPLFHVVIGSSPSADFSQRRPKRSQTAPKPPHRTLVDHSMQRQGFLKNRPCINKHTWAARENYFPVAVLRSDFSQGRRRRPCPVSFYQSERGVDRGCALVPSSGSPCAHAKELLRGHEGDDGRAPKGSHPLVPAYSKAAKQSFMSRAARSTFFRVYPEKAPQQDFAAAGGRRHRRGNASAIREESQSAAVFTTAPYCVFEETSSTKSVPGDRHEENKGGAHAALVEQATAQATTALLRERDTLKARNEPFREHVHFSIFMDDDNQESGELAKRSAASEVQNELRPVRDSQVYSIMLYLVTALDYAAAGFHVVCFVSTWHLASKIGGMFGLKIMNIPF